MGTSTGTDRIWCDTSSMNVERNHSSAVRFVQIDTDRKVNSWVILRGNIVLTTSADALEGCICKGWSDV